MIDCIVYVVATITAPQVDFLVSLILLHMQVVMFFRAFQYMLRLRRPS